MLKSLLQGLSRRDLVRGGGWLAAWAGMGGSATPASAATSNIYQSIGVRPLVNCKGTYTIISGSQSLPEVKKAMDEASRHYVHLDELMNAVGKRLSELTRAEWGIVTAGCAAALTHATAACIARRGPREDAAAAEPRRPQERSHHAALLAQSVRSRLCACWASRRSRWRPGINWPPPSTRARP